MEKGGQKDQRTEHAGPQETLFTFVPVCLPTLLDLFPYLRRGGIMMGPERRDPTIMRRVDPRRSPVDPY